MTDARQNWLIWNYETEEWLPASEWLDEYEWDDEGAMIPVLSPSQRGETHVSGRFGYLLKRRKI